MDRGAAGGHRVGVHQQQPEPDPAGPDPRAGRQAVGNRPQLRAERRLCACWRGRLGPPRLEGAAARSDTPFALSVSLARSLFLPFSPLSFPRSLASSPGPADACLKRCFLSLAGFTPHPTQTPTLRCWSGPCRGRYPEQPVADRPRPHGERHRSGSWPRAGGGSPRPLAAQDHTVRAACVRCRLLLMLRVGR